MNIHHLELCLALTLIVAQTPSRSDAQQTKTSSSMTLMDTDKDQKVSLEEFKQAAKEHSKSQGKAFNEEKTAQLFSKRDVDQDGFLDEAELQTKAAPKKMTLNERKKQIAAEKKKKIEEEAKKKEEEKKAKEEEQEKAEKEKEKEKKRSSNNDDWEGE